MTGRLNTGAIYKSWKLVELLLDLPPTHTMLLLL